MATAILNRPVYQLVLESLLSVFVDEHWPSNVSRDCQNGCVVAEHPLCPSCATYVGLVQNFKAMVTNAAIG